MSLGNTSLSSTFNKIHTGKVRDSYEYKDQRIVIVTDRQSAFDIGVGAIPFKGQVLNQISTWWFENTKDIVPNHLIAMPDPNVSIVKNAKMIPIEVIVRGYMTGTTGTSIWTLYAHGEREFGGNTLPDGLIKNHKLDTPIITPTTKPETGHDHPISPKEIFEQKIVSEEKWEKITEYAFALYKRGVEVAAKRGLIFVDTKYEFGEDENGNIIVCDEVNTPDSSRYWVKESYEQRLEEEEEPESLDKEFLRLYMKNHGINQDSLDLLPQKIFLELSEKYIELYERVTHDKFKKGETVNNKVMERIEKNLHKYYGI